MTEPLAEEESSHVEGPEPRQLADAAPMLWDKLLNIEALNRLTAALDGPVEGDVLPSHEARTFLRAAAASERAELAGMLLRAYRIGLPEPEEAEPPTEAVGGFSGDSDGPGDRDHV